MLLHRPPPRTLGISNIFYGCCCIDMLSWTQASNNFLMMKLTERALLYIGCERELWYFLNVSKIFPIWIGMRRFCNLLASSSVYRPFFLLGLSPRPISKCSYRHEPNETMGPLTAKGI